MNNLYKTAEKVQELCFQNNWRFCIIGGLALIRWGEVRQTQDVDLNLLTGFGNEEPYINTLLKEFQPRRPDAKEFALISRVLLLESDDGTPIDVAMGAFSFEEAMIGRASLFEYLPGIELLTASADDLIITKAFAAREIDWLDIKSIIIRQGKGLDWQLIERELTPLCELKESPETVTKLLALRDKLYEE